MQWDVHALSFSLIRTKIQVTCKSLYLCKHGKVITFYFKTGYVLFIKYLHILLKFFHMHVI